MKRSAKVLRSLLSLCAFTTACAGRSDQLIQDAGARLEGGLADAATFPPGWECLGSPTPVADGGTVNMRWLLLNATNGTAGGKPIVAAAIHACTQIDFACANPFDDTTTDDAGAAILLVPSGFTGFYEVPSASGFNPSLFFLPPQYVDQTQPQAMASSTEITLVGGAAGVVQDPTLGFAIVNANDCTGAPAAGIVFDIGTPGPGEKVVYQQASVPSQSATQTDNTSGSALIFNVPVNGQSLAVTAAFASTGVAIRKITAAGRAGWVTYVLLEPDQATRLPL